MKSKILIVDDDAGIRTFLSKYLKREGYETITAQDGLEAVEKAKMMHPNLIILDVVMPRMDGFRTARLIKFDKSLSKIPIVFLTARDAEREIAMARKTRAEFYITKPFDVQKTMSIITELLSTQNAERNLSMTVNK